MSGLLHDDMDKEAMDKEIEEYVAYYNKNFKPRTRDVVPKLMSEYMGYPEVRPFLTSIPKWGGPGSAWDAYWKAQKDPVKLKARKVNAINMLGWNKIKWENKLAEGILNIRHLDLKIIPDVVTTFYPPVKVLYLNDNQIKLLPVGFFEQMPSLSWLDIRNNRLKKLPRFTKPHASLRVLILQDNKLEYLPYSLCLASKLRSLILKGNDIVDPPLATRNRGTRAVLDYLRLQYDQPGNEEFQSSRADSSTGSQAGSDEDPKEDEEESVLDEEPQYPYSGHTRLISAVAKTFGLQKGQTKFPSSSTSRTSLATTGLGKKSSSKYSFGLWKDMPYDGFRPAELVNTTVQEMRSGVQKKLNAQTANFLQRMKNKEALMQWRRNSAVMQMTNEKAETYEGLYAPFGTDADTDGVEPQVSSPGLDLEKFQEEFRDCWDHLNEFQANPTQVSDSASALKRLLDVQDVEKRILALKLSIRSPLPFP